MVSADEGQAFPAYVAVIAGILFLAFVYFAVGQAAVLRSGAQTAADAAALGAAQDARDQLREGWVEVIRDPAQWQRFVQGEAYSSERSCERAITYASVNAAELLPEDCVPLEFGFTVTVRTDNTVGESIVPGTEAKRATATASAVIEPLCRFEHSEPSAEPTPESSTKPDPTSTPPEEPEEEDPAPIVGLTCDGQEWVVDPDTPTLPGADGLFRVRLTGDNE
ncbi:pilus assembly protein TadG-related protein [Streptomyces sp. NPDC004779]